MVASRWRPSRRSLVVALAACATLAVLVSSRPIAAGKSPLAGYALPSPVRFSARVEERIDTGPYAYLRVARDGAGETWIVAMKPRAFTAGDRVLVDALGRAEAYRSKRLQRTFDELWFAVLTAQ